MVLSADETISSKVIERLENRKVYTSQINPPPSEKLDHVVQFELTTGCSYGGCSFCTMYKGEPHNVKPIGDFKKHVDAVWADLRKREGEAYVSNLERIFIGGGNALRVSPAVLRQAIDYTISSFESNTGSLPTRVAVYGNTRDILDKDKMLLGSWKSDLRVLNCGGTCGNCSIEKFGKKIGLSLVYWGIESGSDEVLKFSKKGYDKEDVLEAASVIRSSGVDVSAMIITGLGGKRLSRSHVEHTVDVLNVLRPEFLTFIGIKAEDSTRYAIKMAQEQAAGINRPLEPWEIANQMADIIGGIKFETTLGCHGVGIHKFGYNPVEFGSVKISNADHWYGEDESKRNLLKQISAEVKRLRRKGI